MRSEADLRAALQDLSSDAPDVADILPSSDAVSSATRLRWLAVAAVAVVVAAVAVAVVLTRRGSTPPAGSPPSALVGIGWQLQSIAGRPVPSRPAPKFFIEPNGRFYQNRRGPCSSVQGRLTGTATSLRIENPHLSFGTCPILGKPPPGLVLRKPGAPTLVYARSPKSTARNHRSTLHGDGIVGQ